MPIHIHRNDEPGRSDLWPEIEPSLLEDGRPALPSFPLDVLPQPWRDWVSDTAHGADAPDDYVAQAVLAAVAGLCGAGVTAQVTPSWSEPLVLWQALIGASSTGKTPALEAIRRPFAIVEQMLRRDGGAADAVAACPPSVLLWRDESMPWLAGLGRKKNDDSARSQLLDAWSAGNKLPVSVIGSLHPERLADSLEGTGDGMAARFLYAWPEPPPYRSLLDGKPPHEDEAVNMLHRIAGAVGTADHPLVLAFDEAALKAFDHFLARLHGEVRRAEGLEAGWLGKGRGTVARLAGVLALLDWSRRAGTDRPPRIISRDHLQAASRLWEGYFRPHARAVFDRGAPIDRDRQARRVIHWIEARGVTEVSREDVRRGALCQSVTAHDADQVIFRLECAGILRATSHEPSGPAARRGAGRSIRRYVRKR